MRKKVASLGLELLELKLFPSTAAVMVAATADVAYASVSDGGSVSDPDDPDDPIDPPPCPEPPPSTPPECPPTDEPTFPPTSPIGPA